MTIAALISDLALQSQVRGAAEIVGQQVVFATSEDALSAAAQAHLPRLILLDLTHPGLRPEGIVARVREASSGATIVAFGPHVHKERLEAARRAGCDLVLSRGQFHADMAAILRRAGGEA